MNILDPRGDEPDYGTCEECGADMVPRDGKFGEFLGCSNWPECRHTEELGEDRRQ